ncbi:Protein of unknown function [Pyronema omphalodes CBS 100304]|uniref:Uncharacterized protein n=1 Tax=Pyronema omphalodes (strain CBS 100304) TaxID=1076935 RepID=U4LHM2_PYROM|nr:Protein of unknown function [Pyronema omphalodes CBS 100304]
MPWPFSLITTARRETQRSTPEPPAAQSTPEPPKQSTTNSRPGSSSRIPRPASPTKSEAAGPATTATATPQPTASISEPGQPASTSTAATATPSAPVGRPSFLSPLQSPLQSPVATPPSGLFSPTAAPSILSTTSEPPAISLDATLLDPTPILNVKVTLPTPRLVPTAPGLKLRLTASLPSGSSRPISFHTRGTIFDPQCPLLGRGGFWGIADSNRRPVRAGNNKASSEEKEKKICARLHAEGGFLDFQEGDFITVRPGEEVVVEKLLVREELVGLKRGEAYTVYSRPDREKKRPARIGRAKWGEREEVAEGVTWTENVEEGWEKVDLAHVVRDRGWFEVIVVVGNSVRFLVV